MELIKKINSIKTNKELLEYKAKVNETFDQREKYINLCEIASNNSKKSFGYIKEAFETISPDLFNTKEGKKIINKFITTIKENNNLSNLYTLHENIRKINADTDIDFFVNTIAETNWNINKQVNNDILKLGRVLSEGILLLGHDSISKLPTEKKSLDNAVKFLSENKKNKNNIVEYSDAIKVIREHIKENKNQNVFENKDIDTFVNEMFSSYNEKYSTLTNEEKEIIKQINLSENKEELFNDYKINCLSKLDNYINNNNNDDEVKKITEVYNKVKNKNFTNENISKDICGFLEITKLFE